MTDFILKDYCNRMPKTIATRKTLPAKIHRLSRVRQKGFPFTGKSEQGYKEQGRGSGVTRSGTIGQSCPWASLP